MAKTNTQKNIEKAIEYVDKAVETAGYAGTKNLLSGVSRSLHNIQEHTSNHTEMLKDNTK